MVKYKQTFPRTHSVTDSTVKLIVIYPTQELTTFDETFEKIDDAKTAYYQLLDELVFLYLEKEMKAA